MEDHQRRNECDCPEREKSNAHPARLSVPTARQMLLVSRANHGRHLRNLPRTPLLLGELGPFLFQALTPLPRVFNLRTSLLNTLRLHFIARRRHHQRFAHERRKSIKSRPPSTSQRPTGHQNRTYVRLRRLDIPRLHPTDRAGSKSNGRIHVRLIHHRNQLSLSQSDKLSHQQKKQTHIQVPRHPSPVAATDPKRKAEPTSALPARRYTLFSVHLTATPRITRATDSKTCIASGIQKDEVNDFKPPTGINTPQIPRVVFACHFQREPNPSFLLRNQHRPESNPTWHGSLRGVLRAPTGDNDGDALRAGLKVLRSVDHTSRT